MNTDRALVEKAYEAAVIPELWEGLCDDLRGELDAGSASIFTVSPKGDVGFVTNPSAREPYQAFAESPLRFKNVRPERAIARAPGIFIRDTDVMTEDEIARDPIYTEFIYPHGLGSAVGCSIQDSTGHVIVFDLMRRFGEGHFSDDQLARLNGMRPDLSRAALLTTRLAFREAKSVSHTLSALGLACAVIGLSGAVMAANPEMEAIGPEIRIGAQDRLLLANSGAQALLQDGLERMMAGIGPKVQSIAVPGADLDSLPVILHLVPIHRQARDIFTQSLFMVLATRVGTVGPIDLRVLSGLFDMTPGESRVARELARGASYDDVATRLGLTLETVRGYAKRIMAKTGTSRQAELVALLAGLGRVGGI